MGMGPNSNTQSQDAGMKPARIGDTRRLIVAVFGVWAMVLQSMLPFAGALAAQSGDEFWVALCTTAGIEDIYLGDNDSNPTDKTSNSAGCDVCTVCACVAGTGCGCGALKLVLQRSFIVATILPPASIHLNRLSYFDPHHTRGPPA